jgi:hypothetical protein
MKNPTDKQNISQNVFERQIRIADMVNKIKMPQSCGIIWAGISVQISNIIFRN